jgi:hypothetical protein
LVAAILILVLLYTVDGDTVAYTTTPPSKQRPNILLSKVRIAHLVAILAGTTYMR